MASISKFPLLFHLRGGPTTYVRHVSKGQVVRQGVGQSFWFRPRTAALSEVPVDDRELPVLVHARTLDFQEITLQASITYRVSDPALAATRLDFEIDPDKGAWRATPLDLLAGVMTQLAQQQAMDVLAELPLGAALADGIGTVRRHLTTGLAGSARLAEIGVSVVGVAIVALRAQPDVERALQTPTREGLQEDADKAVFQRRALAVERERAIAENELQNQIELARREQDLVAERGANDRRRAEEAAAAHRIEAEATAERTAILAAADADSTRLLGAAEGDAEAARLAAYRDLEAATLFGLAIKELAAHLPQINALTVTPDLLTPILAQLAGGRTTTVVAAGAGDDR